MNDKVADLLIRLKNGYRASRQDVVIQYSKLAMAILVVLEKEGYIVSHTADGRDVKVVLKYENREPVLTEVKRISKPGRRVYQNNKNLPKVLNGLGIALISTPKGVMTDKQARKEGTRRRNHGLCLVIIYVTYW